MTVNEMLDLENLFHITQTETVKETGLFEVLKMISKIQREQYEQRVISPSLYGFDTND